MNLRSVYINYANNYYFDMIIVQNRAGGFWMTDNIFVAIMSVMMFVAAAYGFWLDSGK